jgi:two-component system sensor histidine kinase/response regulator
MATILLDLSRNPTIWYAAGAMVVVLLVKLRGMSAALADARQRLAHDLKRLDLALAGADEALWDWNVAQNRTYYSERWARMLGFSPDEIGESVDVWDRLVHPSDLVAAREKLRAHMEGQCESYQAEFRMKTKDGGWRWIRARGKVVARAADGSPLRVAGTHLDITANKQSEEALAREQNRLRTLIDNLPDLIYVKDLESRFLVINHAQAKVLRVTNPAEALGKTDFDFFPQNMAARFRADELKVLETGEPLVGWEEQALDANGNLTWLLTTKAPIRDADGKVVGLVGMGRDIMELRRAREAVEASARLKSQFLANVSHEIRTPMNGVTGMIQLALDTDLTSEQRLFLETAHHSARSLLILLNDILDFSKIEAGKLTLEAVEFRLEETMLDALRTLAVAAHRKGLDLNYSAASDVPGTLVGDPHRLKQVVMNLVGNAIKFTGTGEVTVSAGLLEVLPDGVLLEVAVKDTGIGIPPEKQKGIFEAFTQADGSTTRKYGGTGLGLSICSRLVSLMNGEISVAGAPGRGSTFRFTARLSAAADHGPPSPHPELATLRGRRVLIVDDNATNRRIVGSFTQAIGMRTQLCENAEAALKEVRDAAIRHNPFDILLLDVPLPETGGLDLVREIRSHMRPGQLAIMMLSSVEVSDCVARCRELGIHRYLTKPIGKAELERALFDALNHLPEISPPPPTQLRALQCSLQSFSSPGPQRPGNDAPEHTRRLRVLVAEDNPVNQKVETLVISRLGHSVTLASDGLEALNAVRSSRFDVVFMDVQMPVMDGLQAARSIRQFEVAAQLPAVPIIALTALAMNGDREKCLDAGMNDCLSKPFHIADLERLLKRYQPAFASKENL